MNRDQETFLRDISKELIEENVAIFAGAGMSAGAGFVNWAELLRPIADEIGLSVDKEYDLVALAQYHCNENKGNRSQLNQRLIEEFSKRANATENHKILSRLPIQTFWTTNYDKLIEESLVSAGKLPDVKYTKEHLAHTKPKRDAIVYKMHGDVDHPSQAVLTKDDYEKYHISMDQYLSNLKGDLITKTFIFIGFSFTDPNLDYILSRVRVAFEQHQRRHYCFLKKISKNADESDADFQYRERKQELFVGDLSRFNIRTILVNEYIEITALLKEIENRYKKKSIFISGAAHEYGLWTNEDSLKFIHSLSSQLTALGCKIISGFGLGVGGAVITGALEQIYMISRSNINDKLILRPFPQEQTGKMPQAELWKTYREDMISHAGIAIFLFGNKINDAGSVVKSNGMMQEYQIAKDTGTLIIPVGTTGYAAKDIWDLELIDHKSRNDVSPEFMQLFMDLNDNTKTPQQIIDAIIKFIISLK